MRRAPLVGAALLLALGLAPARVARAQRIPPEVRALLLGDVSVPRILAYQEALAAALEPTPPRDPIPVGAVLAPLCRLAGDRAGASGEPRLELQAALIVATAHALGRSLAPLVGRGAPEPPPRTVTLWGRDDLAKHFLASALATLLRDRAFADLLGVSKELDDSDGGSGFSFADLAADRAGVALAAHAAGGNRNARRVIGQLAPGRSDADLMPDPAPYPEGLTRAEFDERYGSTESPAYRAAVRRIDRAIAQTPVQRALRGR